MLAGLRSLLAPPVAKIQLVSLFVLTIGLPGGSLLWGEGVFAWTMFSKSETYRIDIDVERLDGQHQPLDPRALTGLVSPSLGYFLPAMGAWRHDPMGLTFRTGLGNLGVLACRLGGARSIEVTLQERAHLDATPRVTVSRTNCP